MAAANRPLRVGIIGAGGIARDANVPAYRALGDQVELVAVADIVAAAAERMLQEQGFQRAYTSYEEMLAQEDLDCVSVCTPNKLHAPAAIAALRAGVHVFVVKPPALTADEARDMRAEAARSGRVLTVGFPTRFSAEAQAAKRYVDAGGLGEIYTGRITALRRRGIPSWGVFTSKELQGGGPLIDIGVHALDTALYLMGFPEPASVLGATHTHLGNRPPGPAPWGAWDWRRYDVEDVCNALVTFRNGASLLVETSFIQNIEVMEEFNVRLSGTRAGLRLRPFAVFGEENGTLVDSQAAWLPKGKSYHDLIANFVRAVRGEEPAVCTPDQAVVVQRIIDAIYRSAATGGGVEA